MAVSCNQIYKKYRYEMEILKCSSNVRHIWRKIFNSIVLSEDGANRSFGSNSLSMASARPESAKGRMRSTGNCCAIAVIRPPACVRFVFSSYSGGATIYRTFMIL